MKVLVINGSPRAKGNSDILCDEFIRGAEEAGHQLEKISLREKKFSPVRHVTPASGLVNVSRKTIWLRS